MDENLEKFVKRLIKVPLRNAQKTIILQHKYLDDKDGNEDDGNSDYNYGGEGAGEGDESSNAESENGNVSNSVCGSSDRKDIKKVFKNLRKATRN